MICKTPGYADILLTVTGGDGKQLRFIWEVKKWTIGEDVAHSEAQAYATKINENAWNGNGVVANAGPGWIIGGPYNGSLSGNTIFWGSMEGSVAYANKRDDRASGQVQNLQQNLELMNLGMKDHSWDQWRAPGPPSNPPSSSRGGGSSSGDGGFDPFHLPVIPIPVPDIPIPVP